MAVIASLGGQEPLPGKAFLQAVRIKTEPRGEFARFFLRAEQLLFDEGISVRSVEQRSSR